MCRVTDAVEPSKDILGNAAGRNLTFGLLDSLGKAIVRGDFATRGFPTESDLSQAHGVSRSVTREAVKMLAAKGVLSARRRQGTFIQPEENWNLFDTDVLRWLLERRASIKLLRHFTELRVAVEPQAAALAALRATPRQVAAIAHGLARMRDGESSGDEPLQADIAFHRAILLAAQNPFYAQFQEMVSSALHTSIRFTNRIAGRNASIEDHTAVYEAIAAGDARAARSTMSRLIEDVLNLIEANANRYPDDTGFDDQH